MNTAGLKERERLLDHTQRKKSIFPEKEMHFTLHDTGGKSLVPNDRSSNRLVIITILSLSTSTSTTKDRKNSRSSTSEMWKWNQQIAQPSYFFSSIQVCDGILLERQGKRRERKKEKGRRQVGARTAIYPMQSEIIAYHSVVLVSSVKALRRALWGVRPDRRPWETITKCTLPPFHFCWPCSLRLKPNSVWSVTKGRRPSTLFQCI